MITAPSTTRRLLIPRWRPFALTAGAGELYAQKSRKSLDVSSPHSDELRLKLENWHQRPSEIAAAELLETAIIMGQEEAASSAAELLANAQADVTPLLRRQSQQLLARLHHQNMTAAPSTPSIRDRLREAPDDAILWVELALRQTISGANDAAVRSMQAALKLAPDNRYVLRSASRLFSHLHEPDIGYHLLRKSPATEYDPWLMSAEIAMAGRANRRAAFLKKGLSLLGGEDTPRLEFSELAGAAATTFLEGTIPKRQARKLFLQSLAVPTDNAVAQAEWASQATGERFLDTQRLPGFKRAKEAQAMHAYNIGDYAAALAAAREWICEEQFSGRAYSAAASAANTMDDYKTAIEISAAGIKHDPKSPSLRNSLVFALASSDRLAEAEQAVLDMKQISVDPISELVSSANQGLIAFRRRELERGEALYNKAISGFRRIGGQYLSACALAYLAREAKKARHPKARQIVEEAKRSLEGNRYPLAERLLKAL